MNQGAYVYTPYIWPMFISAGFAAALAAYAWRQRHVPGATAFAIHELGIALWALFTGIEIAALPLSVKVIYHQLEGLFGVLAMGAALQFALERTIPNRQTTRRSARLMAIALAMLTLLMLTNPIHHLLFIGFYFDGFVRVQRGPLNFLVVAGVLLVPLAACLIFLRLFARSRGIHRWQALLFSVGTIVPVLTFLLEPMGINPIAPLDPVILMWNVSGVLYALAIFRFGMLSVVPAGRSTVIERMAQGMLILDRDDRVVDLNPAAESLLGLTRKAAGGHPAAQVLQDYPTLLGLLPAHAEARVQFTLDGAGTARWVEAQATPLLHANGYPLGTLVLLQDITEQRRAQQQMLEQGSALAALQEREQLARELHDSIGQVLGYAGMQMDTAGELLELDRKAEARQILERLAGVLREAHADVRQEIMDLRTTASPQEPFLDGLRRYLRSFSANYGIATELVAGDGPEELPCAPEVQVQLRRILQEALTNVRRHSGASHARVALTCSGRSLDMRIEDDGRGFSVPVAPDSADHYGLSFMRARAEQLGGRLTVQSEPGSGTTLTVTVPAGASHHAHPAG